MATAHAAARIALLVRPLRKARPNCRTHGFWIALQIPYDRIYEPYASTLYAATADGIFKTIDGGRMWAASGLRGTFASALALEPGNPETIYAVTVDGLYKSTDGADTWHIESRAFAAFATAVALDPGDTRTVYLGRTDGLFKSRDAGRTWEDANTGLTATAVQALALDAGRTTTLYAATWDHVFRSTNGGGCWRPVSNGLSNETIASLAADPGHAGFVYASTFRGGVFRSVDAGESWRRLGLAGEHVNVLAIDPRNSNVLYVGTGPAEADDPSGAVLKSTDGGVSWEDTALTWPARPNVVEPERPPVTELAIDPWRPQTVYAGTTRGVFKSTDGGASWKLANEGLRGPDAFAAGVIALVLEPANADTVYVATYGGLFASTDGGEHWRSASSGLPKNDNVEALAADPVHASVVYAGTFSHNVFRSLDGGQSWQPYGRGLKGHAVYALALDRSGRAIYAGTRGRGVLDFELGE
jgi:photosystem II stability/assembly factor-like uncharacterized protein